jgi:hypothetical protein
LDAVPVREIPKFSFFFSSLFLEAGVVSASNLLRGSWRNFFIRFLGGNYLVLGGQFSGCSSSDLSFVIFSFGLGSAFVVFSLSLFDDTHIRLLETIRTSGLEGRG